MTTAAGSPLVSIGLPVYNGAEHLEHTLDTLLNQTWSNFELIISDNGSTDATPEICRDVAANEPRIRFFSQEHNKGAVYNWNFVASKASGDMFKWASVNDYCAPSYVERCVRALLEHPDVVLSYTRTNLLRDRCGGSELDISDIPVLENDPCTRFVKLMRHSGRNNAISGVIRLAPLLATRRIPRYPHGDKVLMAELALHGKFDLIEEPLFFRRWGGQDSSVVSLTPRELREFLDPTQRLDLDVDTWRRVFDFLHRGLVAPVPLTRKGTLIASILRLFVSYRRALWKEARCTVRSALRR